MYNKTFIRKLFKRNLFPHNFNKPIIIVCRNTDKSGKEVQDTGMNNCDTILLVHKREIITLEGRSYTNHTYLKRMMQGSQKANYIASGYYKDAWRKGYHRGYRALVQNKSFMIWRSQDMELMDEDDWNEYNIVADNFHGWAPASAGCVSVKGNMRTPSEDWKIADNWIYNTFKKRTFFSVAIFQHEDLIDTSKKLRIGSKGRYVKRLQKQLVKEGFQLKVDGDFGPVTHFMVRKYQLKKRKQINGVVALY